MRMEQVRPRYESWVEAERKLRATRDLTMKVSLPKLKCLEPVGVAPPSEEDDVCVR